MLTKSEYRIYLYLKHDETFESRIVSLVEKHGLETSEMIGGYKITDKNKFIQRFKEGIYALFWDEFQSGQWQRVVNLSIGLAKEFWDFDFSVVLEFEPIFSPILQKPNALALLGNDAEEKLRELKNGRNPITNDLAIDLPHPLREIQKNGITILTLGGHAYTSDMSVMTTGMQSVPLKSHLDMEWSKRRSILQEIVEQLDPLYGFITDYGDEEVLCMSRHITTWPPLEPWKFFWRRLMIFGDQLSQKIGVEKLRSTPALITEEFGKNLFWIQATDALYHYWSPKSSQLNASQRTTYEKSVMNHLNLIDPFP